MWLMFSSPTVISPWLLYTKVLPFSLLNTARGCYHISGFFKGCNFHKFFHIHKNKNCEPHKWTTWFCCSIIFAEIRSANKKMNNFHKNNINPSKNHLYSIPWQLPKGEYNFPPPRKQEQGGQCRVYWQKGPKGSWKPQDSISGVWSVTLKYHKTNY